MAGLEKEESRRRSNELREKWNEYDPIGVMTDPEWPRDEYENYVGPTMRLLEGQASIDEILSYLGEVSNYMGLDFNRDRALKFSENLIRWYETSWRTTGVAHGAADDG